jgi:hypothetical protein
VHSRLWLIKKGRPTPRPVLVIPPSYVMCLLFTVSSSEPPPRHIVSLPPVAGPPPPPTSYGRQPPTWHRPHYRIVSRACPLCFATAAWRRGGTLTTMSHRPPLRCDPLLGQPTTRGRSGHAQASHPVTAKSFHIRKPTTRLRTYL